MHYQSPLHKINAIAIAIDYKGDRIDGLRLRKQLFAELDISKNISIVINGDEFSKDDIIKLIDSYLLIDDLALHEFIYKNKEVLHFLENEKSELNHRMFSKLTIDKNFEQNFLKLVFFKLTYQIEIFINEMDFEKATNATILLNNIDIELKNDFLIELSSLIDGATDNFNLIANDISSYGFYSLKSLKIECVVNFINNLPNGLENSRFKLSNSLIKLVYENYNYLSNLKSLHPNNKPQNIDLFYEIRNNVILIETQDKVINIKLAKLKFLKLSNEQVNSFSEGTLSCLFTFIAVIIFIIWVLFF